MKAKITLEDGREFEIGEKVDWKNEIDKWVENVIVLNDTLRPNVVSLLYVINNPNSVRKLTPKVKKQVPRTMREIDEIINVQRCEWLFSGSERIGADIQSFSDRGIHISGQRISRVQFRTSPDSAWQSLETKEVEE
jgi:hypothetical protein